MSAPQATPCPECGGLYPVIDCHNCRGGSGTATSSEPWWESPLEFKREWSASGKKLKENLSSSSTCNAETQVAAAPAAEPDNPTCSTCNDTGYTPREPWPAVGEFPCPNGCADRLAAPAAEPDNLVARLREMRTVYMSPASADSRTLAEAADRIEALEARARSYGEAGALKASENQSLRAERDAALARIAELEADAHSFGDRLADATEARDAALARANEEAALADQLAEVLTAIDRAESTLGASFGGPLTEWRARRTQEAP